jgi:hypothetical protein
VIGARKPEISPRYLSEDDRARIADLRRAGLGVRAQPRDERRCAGVSPASGEHGAENRDPEHAA